MSTDRPSSSEPIDLDVEPGLSLGVWLYRELHELYHFETEPWALERAERVTRRLDSARPARRRLQVVIPWVHPVNAFTLPGPYIFFGRRLYQLCSDDETT